MLAANTLIKERYRILHKIGGGGFGYVYKAIDEVFGCSVAIKETREEVANLVKLRKAFEREAKLLRNLKHDSLPRVTDYFFKDQAQFLVMDFIEGEDLAVRLKQHLQEHQKPFACYEILPWADKVLAALEYLHGRPEPIIHRDIKPSNIKLGDDGEIYLLDFGLAKGVTGQMSTLIDGQTVSSVYGFTPEYAPLEQSQDTGTEPQSDIYSLGATLYHLLTGQLPVSASRRDEALQRGLGDPLRPAHEVNHDIPLAVSQVVSQAMAVRWWDRLGSAGEMRTALNRACVEMAAPQTAPATQVASQSMPPESQDAHSTLPLQPLHESAPADDMETPLAATPAHTQKLWRLTRRRPLLLAGLALILTASLALAVHPAFQNLFVPAVSTERDRGKLESPENSKPPQVFTPTVMGQQQSLSGHTGMVWSVAFSPDGSLAASGSADATIILWDTKTWKPAFPSLTGHTGPVYTLAFSPDGKTLASGSHDKTIRLWETQTGKLINILAGEFTKPVLRLAFSPDGSFLAGFSGEQNNGDKEIRLWNTRDGWRSKSLKGHEDALSAIAYSPDKRTLASAGYDNTLRLWDLSGDEQSKILSRYEQPIKALAFSADGKYLACGGSDKTIKLWLYQPQSKRWEELESLKEHKDSITSINFSPDNKTLVSASKDDTVRLWDVEARTSILLSGNQGAPQSLQWSVAFSPDGRTLLTGGKDNMVTVISWR